MENIITKTLILEDERLETLPALFGKHFMQFENLVYGYMNKFCPHYSGGYWDFYKLDNGGFFMALSSDKTFRVFFPENYVDEYMSAKAASIGVNLFALNSLVWDSRSEKITDLYYALRDFAMQHEEGVHIMRWID